MTVSKSSDFWPLFLKQDVFVFILEVAWTIQRNFGFHLKEHLLHCNCNCALQ